MTHVLYATYFDPKINNGEESEPQAIYFGASTAKVFIAQTAFVKALTEYAGWAMEKNVSGIHFLLGNKRIHLWVEEISIK